jgi:hypothetical protein
MDAESLSVRRDLLVRFGPNWAGRILGGDQIGVHGDKDFGPCPTLPTFHHFLSFVMKLPRYLRPSSTMRSLETDN